MSVYLITRALTLVLRFVCFGVTLIGHKIKHSDFLRLSNFYDAGHDIGSGESVDAVWELRCKLISYMISLASLCSPLVTTLHLVLFRMLIRTLML